MTEIFTGEIPGLEIDLAKVLHGEQYFKILKPLPHEAKLTNTFKIQVSLEHHIELENLIFITAGYFGQRKGYGFVDRDRE